MTYKRSYFVLSIMSKEILISCDVRPSLAHDNTWIMRKVLFRRVAACRSKNVFTSARKIKWILQFMSATRDAHKISTHLRMKRVGKMIYVYRDIWRRPNKITWLARHKVKASPCRKSIPIKYKPWREAN